MPFLSPIYHANTSQKKGGVVTLISDKADFKIWKIIRDKEGTYIMIKGSVLQEDIKALIHEYLIIEHQNMKKAKTDRTSRRSKCINSYS